VTGDFPTTQVGYTADDHKYIVPISDVPLTGIEEAVDRLHREAESGDFCSECRGHDVHNPKCPNVSWLCADCGSKLGKCGVSTWHEDRCDACGVVTMVTEERDFRPEVDGTPQATVESCHECGAVEDIEYGEGLLTVAQRHMDAAQVLVDIATRNSDSASSGLSDDEAACRHCGSTKHWTDDCPVLDPTTLRDRMTMLTSEAVEAVAGARNDVYGEPKFDMSATAEMMNGYLHKRGLLPADKALEAFDVAALLETVKLCRLAGQPGHHDSMVDSIGWMGVYQECFR